MPNLSSLGQRLRQYGNSQSQSRATDTTGSTTAAPSSSILAPSAPGRPTSKLRAGIAQFVAAFTAQLKSAGGLKVAVKGLPISIPLPALDALIAAAMRQLEQIPDEQLEGVARMAVVTIEGLLNDDSTADAADAGAGNPGQHDGLRDDSDTDRGPGGAGGQDGQRQISLSCQTDPALAGESTASAGAGDRQQTAVPGNARTERFTGHAPLQ